MVSALGGPDDFVEQPEKYLTKTAVVRPVFSDREGVVAGMDTRGLGLLVVKLGGGRSRADDLIDHSVGLSQIAAIGTKVDGAWPLCMVHASSETDFEMAETEIRKAIQISDEVEAEVTEVYERVTPTVSAQ
jgi:thymidine phosphorylase